MLLGSSAAARCAPRAAHPLHRAWRIAPARGRQQLRRALPVPDKDVIQESAEQVLVDLETRFRMADTDGSGRIDREELKVLLSSVEGGLATPLMLAEGWLPDERVEQAMAKYDVDQSGDIDFEEFKQLVYDGLLLEGAIQDYEDAFNAVDESGNGSLGATELAQLFKKLGTPMSLEKVAAVFMQYDKDESGQIEFGEFLLMFQDQLLDLKQVQAFLEQRSSEEAWQWNPAGSLLETVEGNVSVIFSEQELEEVLSKSGDKLVVLFAGLTWCRPCKGVAKAYERMAQHYDKVTFLKLFGNANQSCKQLFKAMKIRSTPSFFFYKQGNLVGVTTGGNKQRLESTLREYLGAGELPTELYAAGAAVSA